jgi:hypothetical protein
VRSSTYARLGIIAALLSLSAIADVPLSYTGRLVNSNGSPVSGPVNLKVELARTDGALPPSILCTQTISSVPLSNGVFHLKIDFTNAQCGGDPISKVLADTPPGESAAIRVTDITNSKTYSFQAIHAIPFSSVSYYAKSLAQMGAVAGQVLSWNGTQWVPASAGGTGSVTSVATGAGLTGGPITASGTISIATGGITAAMLAQMGAVLGNTLKWNGSAWAPSADAGITSETDPSVQGWAKNSILACSTAQTLRFDALLNSGAGGLYCSNIALGSDAIVEGSSNLFFTTARAQSAAVANSITDAVTDIAPSQNAVFDALATKQNTLSPSSNLTVGSLQASATLSGTSGVEYGARVTPTINQSSSAGYTGLLVNATETATGSGLKKLLDLQVDGVSKFSVDANGTVTSGTATQGTSANYTSAGGSQLVVGYDATNKTTMNVDSLGFTTFNSAGTAGGFNFSGGNVGVGTSAPQYLLDVNGTVGVGPRIFMDRDSSSMSWLGVRGTDGEPASVGFGLLSSSTGTVLEQKFFTAGNQQMTLTSAGKLGLGVSTPGAKLEIGENQTVGEQPLFALVQTGNGDGIISMVKPSARRWTLGFDASDSYKFKIATTIGVPSFDTDMALTVDGSKNVGIGTASPSAALHVVRPNSGTPVILSSGYTGNQIEMTQDASLIHTYTGSDHRYVLSSNSMADVGGLVTSGHDFGGLFLGGASSFSGITAGGQSLHSGQRELYFWTNNNYLFPKMFISAAGNIGVGTAEPEEKVSLYGSDNAVYTSTGSVALPGNGSASLSIFNDAYTDGASAFLNFKVKNANASVDGAYVGALSDTGSSQTAALVFGQRTGVNSYAERMRIGFNGNVGIGTTTTDSKLTVNGNISASGYRAGQGVPNGSDLSTNGFGFGGDGDTGLFAPGAGPGAGAIGLYSNNSEVLRITDTLRVGVGTSAPTQLFSVGPDSNFTVNNSGSVSTQTSVGQPFYTARQMGGSYSYGDGMFLAITENITTPETNVFFEGRADSTINYRVLGNGQGYYARGIGVGTTTLDAKTKLQVQGSDIGGTEVTNDSNDRTTLQIEGNFPNLIIKSQGNLRHSSTIGLWAFDGALTTHQWNMGTGQNGIFSMGYTTNTSNPHAGLADFITPSVLTMLPDGKVGIGTVSPISKLHVVGGASLYGGDLNVADGGNIDSTAVRLFTNSGNLFLQNGVGGMTQFRNKTANPVMTLLDNGHVGIGSTLPANLLTVGTNGIGDTQHPIQISSSSSTGAFFSALKQGSYGLIMGYEGNFGVIRNITADPIIFQTNNGGSNPLTLLANGNVGVGMSNPAVALDVSGTINASGEVRSANVALTSDGRLKERVTRLNGSLEKLLKLNGYSYHWKDKERFSKKKQMGMIAQEVQRLYPESVSKGPDGYFAVSYHTLLAPVVEAIKELHRLFIADQKSSSEEIAVLKLDNARLAKENQEIKARLEKIETALSKK